MQASKELQVSPERPEQQRIEDGFSSDEELQQQELIIAEVKQEQPENNHSEEVRFKIPPPPDRKDKPYSLRPDIQTGWNTKLDLPQPIPIIFETDRYDMLIRRCLRNPKPRAKIIYLGPRFQNTYYAWYDRPFAFPYNHIKAPNDMKFTNRPFCGQHWETENQLIFDSFFQGGNLDCVIKVAERQYDCFMRVDSNTAGHLQWFNFKIRGWKKLLKYKINICNFQKDKCLYTRGMKPYIHSQKRYQKQKITWVQGGDNVRFERKQLQAAKQHDFQFRQMYRLSFEYYTQYDEDQIHVAYCVPYTYTQLGDFLQKLTNRPETKQFLKISKLCTSLGGLQVPLMIVHQGLEEAKEEEEGVPKRCIVISGRAHPGQSNGSHMIQGFIDWLCGDSKEANILRRHVVFKIVPMLNPDGVALGNYRTGLSGRDFNRMYKNPDKSIFPQVYYFKKLVSENKQIFGDRLLMFLDFHGHSTKKNTFMYGPQFPIIDKYYYQARIFPKLLGNVTPMFRYYSCIFKINECKITTARAILLRKLGIPLSYTIETSNGFFFDYQVLKDVPFSMEKWSQMGMKVGSALFEYVDLLLTADRNRWEKKQSKKKDKGSDTLREPGLRKTSKSTNKSKQIKIEKPSIFSAMENEKIRHLFEQIKQAEEDKEKQPMSDDQMSEGSSDGQGAEDDLSPQQANYLHQMIKNGKCRSLSRCNLRHKSRSSRKTTQDPLIIEQAQDIISPNVVLPKEEEYESEEVFRGRRAINIRRPQNSKDRIASLDERKGNTPKIINFSFCSHGTGSRSRDERLKLYIPPRLNFVEMVNSKYSESPTVRRDKNQARVVMDLSDPHFRKTFTHNLRQKQQPLPPANLYLPNKRGRFDHYKYRRMLLHNEGDS